jgi:hypothetical protein
LGLQGTNGVAGSGASFQCDIFVAQTIYYLMSGGANMGIGITSYSF